ncbi:MAG: 2-isopropylmalate synthase [Spirochaetaceae bacterium]|jgi:2-isopropylmalate synthase|nr:2-isopropylmalate synthase [Spirochaetaceae bacterium]
MRRIRILDTTLRDGDQAAGFAFSPEEKLVLARALAEAGVDIIETGFPLSSPADFESCRRIALEFAESRFEGAENAAKGGPVTALMCRGKARDIRETAEVFRDGIPGVLHISLPVSKTHIEAKFGKTEGDLLALAAEAVSFAAGLVPLVELGAEDASRADPAFLLDYCETALDAGAGIVNIADTLGAFDPLRMSGLIAFLLEGVPGFRAGKAVLSVHCHNDFGLACANTLAALEAGCGQVEVSVSGIGERAGNAALEEVAVNLLARQDVYRVRTGIRPEKIPALLHLAAEFSGASGSPLKPLSGWNTRAHGSGIHQQGLLKDKATYSLPLLEDLDFVPERIVLSRHSGKAGVALFARRYCGLDLDEALLSRLRDLLKSTPEPSLGLSEFIRLLAGLGALPAPWPGLLLRTSFSERFSAGTENGGGSRYRYRIAATLRRCRGPEPSGDSGDDSGEVGNSGGDDGVLDGEGETWVKVIPKAVSAYTGTELSLRRLGINGVGEKLRLYAEISTPGGKLYAPERIGSPAGLLLLDCCLDAVNGVALVHSQ